MAIRVTQLSGEVITTATPKLRVTQVSAEVACVTNANVRVSSLVLSRLTHGSNPLLRVSAVTLSRIYKPTPGANVLRVSDIVLSRLVARRQPIVGTGFASPHVFGSGYLAPEENITGFSDNSAQFGSAVLGKMQLGSDSAGSVQTITGTAGLASSQAFGIGGSLSNAQNHVGSVVMDAWTDVAVSANRQVTGAIHCDGTTDVVTNGAKVLYGWTLCNVGTDLAIIKTNQTYAGHFGFTPTTDVAIRAGQTYQRGMGFQCDGLNTVAIRAGIMYRSTTGWTCSGQETVALIRPGVRTTGTIGIAPSTVMSIVAAVGKAATMKMDGTTALQIAYNLTYGATTNWNASGSTDFSLRPGIRYGHLNGFAVNNTVDVAFRSNVLWRNVRMDMGQTMDFLMRPGVYYRSSTGWTMDGGKTDALFRAGIHSFINIGVAMSMNVLFGQEYDTSTLSTPSQFNATFTQNALVLDPGSIPVVIRDERDVYTPPLPSGSFTYGGVKSVLTDIHVGRTIHETGFGLTRETGHLQSIRQHFQAGEETVIFNFFTTGDTSWTPNLPASFVSGGKTSRTDDASQVGLLKIENAVLELTTNAINTQMVVETLAHGGSVVRFTQFGIETIGIFAARNRVSQYAVEVLKLANLAVLEQGAIEVLANGSSLVSRDAVQQVAMELLIGIKANTLLTQLAVHTLRGGGTTSIVRLTEVPVEVLTKYSYENLSLAYADQDAVETLHDANPLLLGQQVSVERLFQPMSHAFVQQSSIETLSNEHSNMRTNQMAAEVMHNGTRNLIAQGTAIEVLVSARFDGTVGALVLNPKFHV